MKNRKLTLSGDEAGIFEVLESIKSADKTAERTWKMGGCLSAIGGIGAFAHLIAFVNNPLLLFPMRAIVICGVILVVGIVMVYRGKGGDIENERYELALEIHKFLSHDCAKYAQYEYCLDLRSYFASSLCLRSEKLASGSISYYQIPLLSARFKLRDGTALAIQVERASTRKTVTKLSCSGKLKTKTKEKFRDIYQIKVKTPEGAPPLPERIQPANFSRDPSYRTRGPRASVVLVQKDAARGGPDPTLLLKLLCLLFYSIHQDRQKAA